jgi:hypothetical protein
MRVFSNIKRLVEFIFRMPTADELAITELEQAKRDLLMMQTALDYSKRMVDYHADRIKRLSAYLNRE